MHRNAVRCVHRCLCPGSHLDDVGVVELRHDADLAPDLARVHGVHEEVGALLDGDPLPRLRVQRGDHHPVGPRPELPVNIRWGGGGEEEVVGGKKDQVRGGMGRVVQRPPTPPKRQTKARQSRAHALELRVARVQHEVPPADVVVHELWLPRLGGDRLLLQPADGWGVGGLVGW